MGSRKEEEKNEKIIRGLMKLPPNRKCINCNASGPQYVCTSFWTFVCMTCSGIHREFTHRVKSVSMSKFTSQEVEALQNGGNQRARELYLKSWDFHRQRLPGNSNAAKIREFIRNVYVDRRYAGANSSEKPPRDPQSPTIHEDEIRRASSYHSYSQSPPYDHQYEDRRYGKRAASLTRKPGSDIGRYEGKISSIIYSPGRFSDHANDDRFANEESGSRISDFSVSSGGEQFKFDVQSPNFHKDPRSSSPSYQHSGSRSSVVRSQARNTPETSAESDGDGIHHPQRATSLQSTDSNFLSLRSTKSGGLVDFFSEPVQASGSLQNNVAGIPQLSVPSRSVSMDLSRAPLASELLSSSSASSVDHFQLPAAPSKAPLVDLFQSSVLSTAPSSYENQPMQTSQPSSVDFFADFSQQPSTTTSAATSQAPPVDLFQSSLPGAPPFNGIQPVHASQPLSIDFFADLSLQPSTATLEAPSQAASVNLFQSSSLSSALSFNGKGNQPEQTPHSSPINFFADLSRKPSTATPDEKLMELSFPKNDRWETFYLPLRASSTLQVEIPAAVPSSAESFQERFCSFSNLNANMQFPSVEMSCVSFPSSVTSNKWPDGVWNGEQVTVIPTSTQPRNALEDSGTHPLVDALSQGSQLNEFPSAHNQFLGLTLSEGSNKGGVQGMNPVGEFGNHDIPSHVHGSPHSLKGDIQPNGINCRSNNPFDYPYDSDAEHNNGFFDMRSLQAVLPVPDGLLPATFHGGIAEPWLPQNTVTPYISSAGEGGLSFMATQPSSSQIQNVQTQEPIATVGGNPFAQD